MNKRLRDNIVLFYDSYSPRSSKECRYQHIVLKGDEDGYLCNYCPMLMRGKMCITPMYDLKVK